jgi:nucleoside-diphosphate-sugar epimerase
MVDRNTAQEVLEEGDLRRVTVVSGDVADPHTINRVIKEHKVRWIVHLASLLSSYAIADPSLAMRVNCQGVINVLEAAQLFSVERVVWASSCSVFGPQECHPSGIVANDAPHYPGNIYAASKSFAENIAEHYHQAFEVDVIGLRFNVVYGKGVKRGGGGGRFNAALFEKPTRHEPSEVDFGDDTSCWQHVEDAAGTILAALDAPPTQTRAFNTCGYVCSVREMGDLVREFIPDAEYHFLPGSMNVAYNYDDSLAVKELGYQGRIPPRDGVRRTLRAFGVAC